MKSEHRDGVLAAMADFFDKSAQGHHRTHRPAKTQHSESSCLLESAKSTKSEKSPASPLTAPTIAEHFTGDNRSSQRANAQASHRQDSGDRAARNGQAVSIRANGEIMD